MIKRTDGDKFSVQSIFSSLSYLGSKKGDATAAPAPASPHDDSSTRSPDQRARKHHDGGTIKIERSDGLNNDLIHLATRVMTEQKMANTVLAPTTCRIVHFSDTFNHLRRQSGLKMLPEGDIMIHSGGFTRYTRVARLDTTSYWVHPVPTGRTNNAYNAPSPCASTSNGTPEEFARFNRWLFAVKDLYR